MKKYKAVIFDLDGTAIPNAPNAMPSQELIDVVNEADEKMFLCVATGRPITNASYILDALNLTNPCVISAGTQIVNPQTKKILWEELMDLDSSRKIIEICKPYPYKVLLRDELLDVGKTALEIDITKPVNVMYVMQVQQNDANEILKKFEAITSITASPVTSWMQDGVDIHITAKNATKEHAIEELLRLINIKKDEVAGVGDADNDIHLFKSVGYKVAMGNATENLKQEADVVIETVENDGLAKFIKHLSAGF